MPEERAPEAAYERALDILQAQLNALRESISRELCSIPPPVPACDVNFNRLLEDRGRVVDELQRLSRLRASHAGIDEILAFCRSCSGLDARARSRLESLLLEAGKGLRDP